MRWYTCAMTKRGKYLPAYDNEDERSQVTMYPLQRVTPFLVQISVPQIPSYAKSYRSGTTTLLYSDRDSDGSGANAAFISTSEICTATCRAARPGKKYAGPLEGGMCLRLAWYRSARPELSPASPERGVGLAASTIEPLASMSRRYLFSAAS